MEHKIICILLERRHGLGLYTMAESPYPTRPLLILDEICTGNLGFWLKYILKNLAPI